MRRLLPALICALAFHAIILSTDFSWLMLAPRPAPPSRFLSISLSADTFQKHKEPAAVSKKQPEKPFQPDFQPKRIKKTDSSPATARLENAVRKQKRPSANTSKKSRQKKNLKALTRKIAPVNTIEATRAVSIDNEHVSPAAQAKIFSPVSSAQQRSHEQLAAETVFIKKTKRMADEFTNSMTSAAALTSRQSDQSVSATALIMAKPLYRQNPTPSYPRKARRMGYEGIVMLKVLVDENGRVGDLMLLESSGYPILDRTALASVRKWRFEPGTEGGIKKKMWVRVPIRFRLK